MSRAVVLIGVKKVHNLPNLRAVDSGIGAMRKWAISQNIPETDVRVVTDEKCPVLVSKVTTEISELVRRGNVQQLIVYFAGHGLNIGGHDFWLLSNALNDSGAAVHVTESEVRARYCGIPHVVFFADTCRTLAPKDGFQCLRGNSIFPNPSLHVYENYVDVLNGTSLWEPAFEIQRDGENCDFLSIYTTVLIEALSGTHSSIIDKTGNENEWVLKVRDLHRFLVDEVPKRFSEMVDRTTLSMRTQIPSGRVSSDDAGIAYFKYATLESSKDIYPLPGTFKFENLKTFEVQDSKPNGRIEMNRAVVLIGVQKAYNLPVLQAVLAGVDGMEEWALSQGIPSARIKKITDKDERVTPQLIKDAVNKLLEPGDLDQLIIYFAGHGVNIGYAEYWLLSEAIIDSDAAVNVKASEERARSSSVPHVVFISDACRTAAAGIQAQGILGSTIFRNPPAPGPAKPVDLFFATQVGDPALEIKDPNEAAQGFKAVYTEALLEALRGQRPEIAEPDSEAGGDVIRPWPLQDFLEKELPIRVYQATLGQNPRSQLPEARITSRPSKTWISLVPTTVDGSSPPKFAGPPPDDARKHSELTKLACNRTTLATRALLVERGSGLEMAMTSIPLAESISRSDLDVFSKTNRRFRDDVRSLSQPFGSLHMETRCGFKIRGARIAKCTGSMESHVFDDGTGAHTMVAEHSACSYLLEFQNGTGALLPAIGGFLSTLTFKDEQLIDVAYEPSEYTDRWSEYESRADDIEHSVRRLQRRHEWARSDCKAMMPVNSLAACNWLKESIRHSRCTQLMRIATKVIETEFERWLNS
jgi:uncharacterized protein YraI